MWLCKRCGKDVEDYLDVCWNCQTNRSEKADTHPESTIDGDGRDAHPKQHRRKHATVGAQLRNRYQDAYRVARATIRVGSVVKVMAVILAVITVMFAIGVGRLAMEAIIATLLIGAVWSIILYVLGVLIAALGQIVLTTIDTAINTSSFLDDQSRAAIMRIELAGTDQAGAGEAIVAGGSPAMAGVFADMQMYAKDKRTKWSLQKKLDVLRVNESTGLLADSLILSEGTIVRMDGEIGEGDDRNIVLAADGMYFLADHIALRKALDLD